MDGSTQRSVDELAKILGFFTKKKGWAKAVAYVLLDFIACIADHEEGGDGTVILDDLTGQDKRAMLKDVVSHLNDQLPEKLRVKI